MSRIAVLIFLLLIYVSKPYSHEEPAKTLKEKAEKERARTEMLNKKVASYTVWKYKITGNSPDVDSKEKYYTAFFDPSGNISEMIEYGSSGEVKGKTVFGYDDQNNMITDTDYGPDGMVNDKIIYQYDGWGRVTEQINYTGGGAVDSKFTYTIDSAAKRLLFCKYKPLDSVEYRIVYTYESDVDRGNNILAEKQDPSGRLVLRIENEFNSQNLRTKKKIYDENSLLSYYFEYAYENGNENFSSIKKMSPQDALLTVTEYGMNETRLISTAKTTDNNGNILSYFSYEYTFNK